MLRLCSSFLKGAFGLHQCFYALKCLICICLNLIFNISSEIRMPTCFRSPRVSVQDLTLIYSLLTLHYFTLYIEHLNVNFSIFLLVFTHFSMLCGVRRVCSDEGAFISDSFQLSQTARVFIFTTSSQTAWRRRDGRGEKQQQHYDIFIPNKACQYRKLSIFFIFYFIQVLRMVWGGLAPRRCTSTKLHK